MFLYIVLLITSLVTAAIIPLLYHLFTGAGMASYESVIPPSKRGFYGRLKIDPKYSIDEEMPIPLGLVNRETHGILAWANSTSKKVELQFSGDNSYNGPRKVFSAPLQAKVQMQASRFHREEKRTDVGSAYKVTRRSGIRAKNLKRATR